MKYLTLVLLAILMIGTASAQRFGSTNGVDEVIMQGHDYVNFDESAKKEFWAINTNIFVGSQKSTFQDFVFNSEYLVACSTPDANGYWYLSSLKTVDNSLVILEIEKLISKAKLMSTNGQDKYNK